MRGLTVTAWSVDEFGVLALTVTADRRTPLGFATIVVARIDGSVTTFEVEVT